MRAQEQIESWDRLLTAARATLRARGLAEVVTPSRVAEIAIEPFIEPVPAPPGVLRTSPELAHKHLISEGARDFFEIAAVFRRGEHGARHREEFHLLEWYRVEPDLRREHGDGAKHGDERETPHVDAAVIPPPAVDPGPGLARACRGDLEAVVEAVFEAMMPIRSRTSRKDDGRGDRSAEIPRAGQWRNASFFEVFARTVGVELRGDEEVEELIEVLGPVRPQWASALREDRARASNSTAKIATPSGSRQPGAAAPLHGAGAQMDGAAAQLRAWTSLWSFWSDADLDPWLELQPSGVHLGEFPPPLAALAEISPVSTASSGTMRLVAARTESYVAGIELGNGYLELRDASEQRRRFEVVRALHSDAAADSAAPSARANSGARAGAWMERHWPSEFLAMLESRTLPRCAGLAMGLERLLCVALGHRDLDQLLPADNCRPTGA